MNILFHTLGCKLNFAETSDLGRQLLERGHKKAGKTDEPDLIVLNTCSVTDAADHKGRQAINHLHHLYPKAKIIVTGCYAQLKPQEISEIEGVDYVLGTEEKFQIPNIIKDIEADVNQAQIQTSDVRRLRRFHPSYSKGDRTRCFLKIQDGCDYFCTYCTIPLARGRSRSESIKEIVEQADKILKEGIKEIVLTGVNIGDFGRDTGEKFIDLLRELDSIESQENYRYRISSCEPNLLNDEIIEFVSKSRHFAPHFHIPLQSGSNEILQIMHRRYNRELFKERVDFIKSVMPDAFIGVDVMVGVRGETDELFEDAFNFIKTLNVSQLHVFTYSERANTKMLSLPLYVVPKKIRKERSERMHELSNKKHADFTASQKGKKGIVLWEGKNTDGMMSGFTGNYLRVSAPYNAQKINTFELAQI